VRRAGALAGLHVERILNEPTAASLAYAWGRNVRERVLVYDLGGGTFDVTLIRTTLAPGAGNAMDLKVDTLCKDGNAALGGLDWDRALAEIVAEKVQQVHGIDITLDLKNEALLLDNCEKAKRHLSRVGSVSVVADAANHQVEVSVAEFEDRTNDLLLQTQMLLEKVIDDAEKTHGIRRDSIDVMLSGGSSKMPMVKKMITGVLGRAPLEYKNPELLVTIGAAYWAHLLQSTGTVQMAVPTPDGGRQTTTVSMGPAGITEIASEAVGVEVLRPDGPGQWRRSNAVIVPRAAAYERDFKKEFQTTEDDMTEVPIVLYKGDADDLDQCEQLMTFTIGGLPPGRPAGQRIEVTLRYDSSGILRGTAVDLATRKACDIVIDRDKALKATA
jgi:molecular chaperone DnaK